MNIAVLYFRIT